jgi:arylsulfatase A-like enzyme
VKDSKNPDARDLYDAELAYLDQDLGRLFHELERRGDLKNTMVIVTSDHGEHFGERGLWSHGNSLYYALLHVPLIVRFDGQVPAGRRVPDVVSLRDVGATILDLAGLGSRVPFPGVSLAGRWRDGVTTSPAMENISGTDGGSDLADGEPPACVAGDGDWHLIREGRQLVEELFHYRDDPAERIQPGWLSPEGMSALRDMRETITGPWWRMRLIPGTPQNRPERRAAADSARY